MTTPTFLGVDHVQRIHQRVVEEFGGDPATRDASLLESAVAIPAATFDSEYLHHSLAAMGAAYLFHLCRNHPFVDGNKRTALACAEIFLALNGAALEATNDEVVELTLGVASGEVSKDAVTSFFDAHVG